MSYKQRTDFLITILIQTAFLMPWAAAVRGDVLHMSAGLTSLEFVPVGNPGNAADSRVMTDGTSGYGSVPYAFSMGKYEVTAGQYAEFLNAVGATDTYGLYNADWSPHPSGYYGNGVIRSGTSGSYSYAVASDWANRPMTWVTLWDTMRFANWLHNGQPTGAQGAATTEDGAYTLNGYIGSDGSWITRNPGARFAIPSENEWYKAAYYDPDKPGGAGYWDYPTGSNAVPANTVLPLDPGNNANYFAAPPNDFYSIGAPYFKTEVGEFENSESPFGTFDQAGNVRECTETIFGPSGPTAYLFAKGGSFNINTSYGYAGDFHASSRAVLYPVSHEGEIEGFRVTAVPEPSTAVLGMLGVVLAFWWLRTSRVRNSTRHSP